MFSLLFLIFFIRYSANFSLQIFAFWRLPWILWLLRIAKIPNVAQPDAICHSLLLPIFHCPFSSDLNTIYFMPMSYPSTRPTNNQILPIFTFFFFKHFFLFCLHSVCVLIVHAQSYPIYMYDYFPQLKLAELSGTISA